MKRITKIALAAGTALSLGLAAATVSAHPYGYGPGGMGGPGYGPGAGMMGGYGPGPGMMGGYGPGNGRGPGMMGGYGPGYGMGPQAMWGGNFGNADENLASLKSQLAVTEKQEGAWQSFAKNAKQQSEARQAWFAKMQQAHSAGSAPEFAAQQAEFMKQREAEMQANATALKDLYAALTPEQKQIADQSFGGYGPAYCQQAYGGRGGRFH